MPKPSLKVLNSKEIKNIKSMLREQFGFENELGYVFLKNEKDKVYIVSKDISKINLDGIKINNAGLYFAQLKDGQLRLSIDGSQLIGEHCNKNIIEIEDDKLKQWFKGEDLTVNDKLKNNEFIILKNQGNFIGCGKHSNGKILNFVSKPRRIGS